MKTLNEQDIAAYCNNLKRSIIDAIRAKSPVTISIKHDTDLFELRDMKDDVVWNGCKIEICIGRPASDRHVERLCQEHFASSLAVPASK